MDAVTDQASIMVPHSVLSYKVSDLCKEGYVDERGGVIILNDAKVSLHVPANALSERKLLSIEVKSVTYPGKDNLLHSSLTPVISCKPRGMNFKKEVELIVPHCAVFDDVTLHNSEVQLESNRETVAGGIDYSSSMMGCCKILKEYFCHIYTKIFGDFKLPATEATRRRIKVVAFSRRDQRNLIIEVWLLNDLPSEYIIINHQQEEKSFIPFRTTDQFTFDYYLTYKVEVRTAFSGKYFAQKYDEVIDNTEVVWKGRSCLRFCVTEGYIDMLPQNVSVSILHGSVPKCRPLKLMADSTSHTDSQETEGLLLTISDVSRYCEDLSEQLLNWKLEKISEEPTFDEGNILLLESIFSEIEANKRKKNVGLIGGSSVGIVGGAMSIIGASLMPLTFGASAAILAAGISISIAGTGINLGFSIDKILRDKMRINSTKECLEHFIDFQTKVLTSVANIFAARTKIRQLRSLKKNLSVEAKLCDTVKRYVVENETRHTVDMMKLTYVLAEIQKQSTELFKCLQEVEDSIDMDLTQNNEDSLKTIVSHKDDIIKRLTGNVTNRFGEFVKDYLQLGETPTSEISMPVMEAVKVRQSTAVRAGAMAVRMTLDVGDDIISAGGNALKIAQGLSAASIALGLAEVAVDVGFIRHAINDPLQTDKLSRGLLDIADLMLVVNKLQLNYTDPENRPNHDLCLRLLAKASKA